MISRMNRYLFVLLSADKDKFLTDLQGLGLMDIKRSAKPVDARSEALLQDIASIREKVVRIEKGIDPGLTALEAKMKDLAAERDESAAWGPFDRGKLSSLGLDVRFHIVPRRSFDPSWEERYPLQVISSDKESVRFVTVGAEGFNVPSVPAPARNTAAIEADITEVREEMERIRKAMDASKADIPALKAEAEALQSELSLYLAGTTSEGAADGLLQVFEAYAPADAAAEIEPVLDRMDCWWTADEAQVSDNPPIRFENNRFVRMFEPLTDMYGRPGYDGFDPTPYISIFFLLFFAMCMGDAGYGLLLIIVGVLLRKVKSFASLAPLVITLGIGTVVVGFFFHTFFSMDFAQWKCFPEALNGILLPTTVGGYDGTMLVSIGIGIVHLCLAMIVKTVNATSRKGFLESLSIWGWTLFLVGSAVVGAVALAGAIDKDTTRIVIIVLGAVSALGIFLFNDIHRNPLKNIGSGLWETYNTATGVLGDVLSYLRLYALGLAGSMLGFAFNNLAVMARGDGGFGWVGFFLIVIVGHTLNLAMAVLGAFVHPLRLNFLEFFKNSGYDGSGVKYDPLTTNKQK